jgi:ATP-dependent Lhr-like helicase
VTNRLRDEALCQAEAAFAPSPAATPALTPMPAGRWSLVHRASVLGPPASDEARAERLARILLARYGVVSHESLEREAGAWEWSQLYRVYQRLELRGEVRRGYFVVGFSGIQFALPAAVEALRERRASDETIVVLNATDPANILGGEYPGTAALRFARLFSTHIALLCGRSVALFEVGGAQITALPGAEAGAVSRAVSAYLARPFAPRRVVVSRWNDVSVLGSPGEALLRVLGFQSTPSAMEWWAGH